MIRVYLTTDEDGHNYIIPYDLKDEFEIDCEIAYKTEEFDYFIEKYDKYATGGGYDNVELYADL